jgi:glycosyltransferase involved in cell wall biosynthesis
MDLRQDRGGNNVTSSGLGVVIPAFNASATIQETVASAFRSGAAVVLVVDDGSTDSTADQAAAAGADVIRQPNSGAASARRRGVQEIQTAWVVLLDADDTLIEQGLAHAISLLADRPSAVAVVGRVRMRFADGTYRCSTPWDVIDTEQLLLIGHSPCPPAAVTWRASALKEALAEHPPGLWPAFAEDYELLIRGSLVGEIVSHGFVSAEYRAFGGKSDRHAVEAARAAIAIAEWYSAETGRYTPRRPRRGAEAQVALRRATSRNRSVSSAVGVIYHLTRAAIYDPRFVLRWAGVRLSRRRTIRERAARRK